MKKERGRVVQGGMGGFLNPPTHPEHDWHIETDLRRRPENRGGMSLTGAIESTWLDAGTKAEARKLLKSWQPPPLNSPEIVDWRQQVLGYFRGCYRNPNAPSGHEWDASNVVIDQTRDPVLSADDHAGVRLIRKFYPEFVPTADDFRGAYWGTKPTTAESPRRSQRHAVRESSRDYSMTYGVLPPYEKFIVDIRRINPDDDEPYWAEGKTYPMELVDSHEQQLALDYGLDEFTTERARTGRNSNAIGFRGDEEQIYGFLGFLIEAFENGDEQAGDLASSIMSALGYEWI